MSTIRDESNAGVDGCYFRRWASRCYGHKLMRSDEENVRLQQEIDSLAWFHSMDLGEGLQSHGLAAASVAHAIDAHLPDFKGKSVLDIGAWDGRYSFLAEQRGARRVVALDHYAWGVDMVARDKYWSECAKSNVQPDQSRDLTDFWRPDLPGQRAFNLARKILNSQVESIVADFATMDLDSLGQFDVVLYLGVLYHMKEPLTALERVRQVTNQMALIETVATDIAGYEELGLVRFHSGSDLGTDFGNWFVPSAAGLIGLCHAAGFSQVEVKQGPSPRPASVSPYVADYRAIVQAFV